MECSKWPSLCQSRLESMGRVDVIMNQLQPNYKKETGRVGEEVHRKGTFPRSPGRDVASAILG